MPEDVKLPEDDILAHKNPEHLNKSLSNQAKENLREWYKEDYDFIALCKDIIRDHP